MAEKNITLSIEIVENLIETQQRLDGTKKNVEALKTELSKLSDEYRKVASDERNGIKTADERAKAEAKLNAEVKKVKDELVREHIELAKVTLEHKKAQTAIDNTAKAQDVLGILTSKAKTSVSEMQQQLTELSALKLEGVPTKDIQQIEDAIAKLKDELLKIEQTKPANIIKNVSNAFDLVINSADAASKSLGLFGKYSPQIENFKNNIVALKGKFDGTVAVIKSITTVTNFFTSSQYANIKAMVTGLPTMIATTAARLKDNIMMGVQIITYKAFGTAVNMASKQVAIFKAALISTGLGALIVGIGTLVSWIMSLGSKTKDTTDKFKYFTDAINDAAASSAQQVASVQKLSMQWNNLGENLEDKKKFIADNKEEFKKLGVEVNSVADAENLLSNNTDNFVKALQKKAMAAAFMKEASKRYETAVQAMLTAERLGIEHLLKAANDVLVSAGDDMVRKSLDFTSQYEQIMKESGLNVYNNTKSSGEKQKKQTIENAQKQLEQEKQLADECLKEDKANEEKRLVSSNASATERLKSQHAFAQRELQELHQHEQNKLKIKLSYNEITQNQYEEQLAQMLAIQEKQKNTLNIQQQTQIDVQVNSNIEEEKKKLKNNLEELNSLLKKSADDEIKEIEKKFAKAQETLKNIPESEMSEGNKEIKKVELDKEKERQISEIKRKALDKEYADELAKFADNTRERLKLEIEKQEKIIAIKKAADEETGADEAKLRELKTQQVNANMALEIAMIEKNHKAIYESKRKAILAEMKIHEGNADKQIELQSKLNKLDKEYNKERIGRFEKNAAELKNIMSSVFGVFEELEKGDLQRVENDAEEEKELLQQQLDAGVISKEEHAEKTAEIDKKLDDKKAEIARKQAIRDKLTKIFDIGVNTASAIMRIWADVPKVDFGISTGLLTAMASAMGAAQIAAVMATPLPKAAKGGRIVGPSHAQGGVLLEAEGGEYIVNKRSSAMFGGLLSMLNSSNVGRYSQPFGDGGFAYRTMSQQNSNSLSAESISAAVTAGMQKANVYVAVEDIDKMQNKIKVTDKDTSF